MSGETSPWQPELSCPHLPPVEGKLTAASMQAFRHDRGPDFYVGALRYAQSLWMEGKPAQAILQLNKAMSADLAGDEAVLRSYPAPYRSLVWILEQDIQDAFLGNPVRHFQHLATRMCGPRAELRSWRAWACFHLSERILEAEDFPRDEDQLRKEALAIPPVLRVLQALSDQGWVGERQQVDQLLGEKGE